MKKKIGFFILFACIFLSANCFAQWDPAWNIGAGIGGNVGVNEAINQSLNPQFHLYGLWLNGIAPHWSAEGGIGIGKISSPHQGGYSEYSTNLVPIDLRIRFAPLESNQWQLYIYAGIGLVNYSVTSIPPNVSSDAKLSGTAGLFLLGIGLYHPLDKQWAIEGEAGIRPSFTDDLNPVHDNRNDAYWGFTIGITYSFSGGGQSESAAEFELGVRGSTRILTTVTFDSAKASLNKESELQLSEILSTLNDHPEIEVEFRAYTDNSGDFNTNMALTHDRAESVKVWLVSRGISATRISTQGYGPHNPLVPNDTPENRKRNCRIEIVRMK